MPFGPRPQNHVTQLRYKRQHRETLTEDEAATLSAAEAKYRERKTTIHVSPERKKTWKKLAEKQRSLSAWIVMMVEKGINGFEDAVQDLRAENQRLRDENTALRGTCGQLSVENSDMKTRVEGLEGTLKEALQQALRSAANKKGDQA